MSWFGPPFSADISLTESERREVRRRVKQLVARRRLTWCLIAVATLAPVLLFPILSSLIQTLHGWGVPFGVAIAICNLSAVGGILGFTFYVLHPIRRRAYREAVRELGFPVCVHCGYLLRPQDGDTATIARSCPECGKER
jgi:MFS family permease